MADWNISVTRKINFLIDIAHLKYVLLSLLPQWIKCIISTTVSQSYWTSCFIIKTTDFSISKCFVLLYNIHYYMYIKHFYILFFLYIAFHLFSSVCIHSFSRIVFVQTNKNYSMRNICYNNNVIIYFYM